MTYKINQETYNDNTINVINLAIDILNFPVISPNAFENSKIDGLDFLKLVYSLDVEMLKTLAINPIQSDLTLIDDVNYLYNEFVNKLFLTLYHITIYTKTGKADRHNLNMKIFINIMNDIKNALYKVKNHNSGDFYPVIFDSKFLEITKNALEGKR